MTATPSPSGATPNRAALVAEALIRWVDASHGPDEGLVERNQQRAQHLITLLDVSVASSYVIVFYYWGITWAPAVLLPLVAIAPIGLFLCTRRGRPRLGGWLISISSLLLLTGCMVARGGMATNAPAWLLSARESFVGAGREMGRGGPRGPGCRPSSIHLLGDHEP